MPLHRISVVSVLLLALGGAVALADPNPRFSRSLAQNTERQRPAERTQPGLMEELNLTQEQKQKLEAIRVQYKDEISQRQQELRQTAQELRTLMEGTASADEIRTKHQQVQAISQQLGDLRFESMLAMREVLSPEQRRRFATAMQQRREDFRNQMENRRGPEF